MSQSNTAGGWPSPETYRRSIKVEIALYLSGALVLLMAVTGYVTTNRFVSAVTERLVETLVVQARAHASLAGKHIIASEQPDVVMLSSLCTKLAADNPDVLWAGVVGTQHTYVAHTNIKQVVNGQKAVEVASSEAYPSLRPGETLHIANDSLMISIPIEEQGVRLGQLQIAASDRNIAAARKNSIMTMGVITGLMLLIGMPLTWVTLSRRLRPFSVIVGSLRKVEPQNPVIDIPVKSANEFGYLADTLRAMGARLVDAQRLLVEQERMARELEIAREIQLSILPKSYPSGTSYQFCGTYRSAKEVGGDYFDFVLIDESHLGFLVADVSGKSLPGMLVMLMTRDIVLKYARSTKEPAEVLSLVNRELHSNIRKGMFVTMFYGVIDLLSGSVSFASAGHNPLLHVTQTSGQVSQLKTKGFPLGMMPEEAFRKRIEQQTIELQSGDWLIQYTDGVNEALNADRQEFGLERLVESTQRLAGYQPEELVSGFLTAHQSFVGQAEQYDDITLLALKWHGATADKHQIQERPIDYVRSV